VVAHLRPPLGGEVLRGGTGLDRQGEGARAVFSCGEWTAR
jgi:hypothetical protein